MFPVPRARLVDAIKRAVRTFIQVYVATASAGAFDVLSTDQQERALLGAAGAALALLWRLVLDPSPVPSLQSDHTLSQTELDSQIAAKVATLNAEIETLKKAAKPPAKPRAPRKPAA